MKRLLPLVVLAAGPLVRGAEVVVDEPVYGASRIVLNLAVTNNDDGAVYDTAVLHVAVTLSNRLASTNGVPGADGMSEWSNSINPSGEVDAGWSLAPHGDGTIGISKPLPFGYELWQATQQNAALAAGARGFCGVDGLWQ